MKRENFQRAEQVVSELNVIEGDLATLDTLNGYTMMKVSNLSGGIQMVYTDAKGKIIALMRKDLLQRKKLLEEELENL